MFKFWCLLQLNTKLKEWSPDSSFSAANALRAVKPSKRTSIPDSNKIFFSAPTYPPSLIFNGHWQFLPGLKLPVREVDL